MYDFETIAKIDEEIKHNYNRDVNAGVMVNVYTRPKTLYDLPVRIISTYIPCRWLKRYKKCFPSDEYIVYAEATNHVVKEINN